MTTKECLYRELRYGLCAGALSGLVAGDHIAMDLRPTPSAQRSESDYPWLIFRRVTEGEDNQVAYQRERFEIVLIGLHESSTKGDDLLEQVKDAIKGHFAGKRKTWGKFDANGNADSGGGVKLKCVYLDTADSFSDDLDEKVQIMQFIFTRVRA